jgi:TRAP-type mannitol/chloroaromatic compound transport system permease small subunit
VNNPPSRSGGGRGGTEGLLNVIIRSIDRLNAATGVVAAALVVPLVLSMCWEVVARYVFGAPTIWAYELAFMLTGASWMLGMAYTLAKGAHIRIDVLSARFPPRVKAAIDLLLYLVLLPLIVWIVIALDDRVVQSFLSDEHSGQSAWNPPIWPFRAVFLASFVLLGLQIVAEILRSVGALRGAAEPRVVSAAADEALP